MLTTADNITTFRFVVKNVAIRNGLHATFMPKPIYGINGSGMHTHMSLFSGGTNIFYDAKAQWQLSETCLSYIGGILLHAKGFCAITNPLVNSYKRLVPGYEAPTNIAWSEKNRSPLVRVPAPRGTATRIELRMPDPSCNPYLALAVMLRAGLDGIEKKLDPGPPINKNIYKMSHRERRHLRIDELPGNLNEALDELEKDDVVREALGAHIARQLVPLGLAALGERRLLRTELTLQPHTGCQCMEPHGRRVQRSAIRSESLRHSTPSPDGHIS